MYNTTCHSRVGGNPVQKGKYTMATHLSIWHLVASADPLVKLILLVLLAASIWSWTIIFTKFNLVKAARKQFTRFEKQFWSGQEIGQFYEEQASSTSAKRGAGKLFHVGFREYVRLNEGAHAPVADVLGGVERVMTVASEREYAAMKSDLSVLATLAAVSPFVGLFGTVWGIMTAFQSLGGVAQATLSMVAPGISEALIATAMGLFVAIPAALAYNRFSARVESLAGEYDNFQDELVSILQRDAHKRGITHA
jgi:biopolymer transport protein TolQ